MSPLYEMHKEGIDLKIDPVGGALSAREAQEPRRDVMAYSDKVIEHYENPRNVGTLDKRRPERRHRPRRRARVRRRDAPADQGRATTA